MIGAYKSVQSCLAVCLAALAAAALPSFVARASEVPYAFDYAGSAAAWLDADAPTRTLEDNDSFTKTVREWKSPDGKLVLRSTEKAYKRFPAHEYLPELVCASDAPTEIEDGQYLFLIGGEDAAEVTFTLDGESAEQTVGYEPNKIVGTIQQPLELTVRKASDRAEKILINDHVFIRRDGKTYSIIGQEINK